MAIITPYQDTPNPQSYLGLSKEIDPGKARNTVATGIEGATDLFKLGVHAVDNVFKENIDNKLFAEINAERQDSIAAGQSVIQGGAGEAPTQGTTGYSARAGINADGERVNYATADVPQAVANADRRMAIWAQANKMGKFEDNAYYGRMQEITQRVTAEYPGYARYIQDRATHWLGANSANAQRSSIQQTIAQISGNRDKTEDKWQTFIGQNAKYFVGPDGKFNQTMWQRAQQAIGTEDEQNIRTYVAEKQATEHSATLDGQEMERIAKGRKLRSDDVEAYAHREGNRIMQSILGEVSFNVRGTQVNFQQAQQVYAQMQKDPNANREELAALGHTLGLYSKRIESEFRLWGNNRQIDGRSVVAWVGDRAKWDGIVANYSKDFMNPIIADVGAGNLDAATRTTNTLAGNRENLALQGLFQQDIRDFAQLGALENAAQAAVIQHRLNQETTGVGIQDRIIRDLRDMNMRRVGSGMGNPSMLNLLERYGVANPNRAGVPTTTGEVQRLGEYTRSVVTDAQELLLNEKATATQRVNAARVISHPENAEFLSKVRDDQQLRMFRSIATPATTDMIWEIGRRNGEVWDNYQTTAQQMFKRAYNTHIGNITQGARDAFGTNISFNEKDGRFEFTDPRSRQSIGASRQSVALPISATAQQAIKEVNSALDSYRYILEKNGQKLDENELGALGIILKPQPTSDSPNGSQRPSTKDKRSELRGIESMGGDGESIPLGARETSGMNLGAPAIAEGLSSDPLTRPFEGNPQTIEQGMEIRLDKQGPIEDERSIGRDNAVRTQRRDVAMMPGDRDNPRPGRLEGGGGTTAGSGNPGGKEIKGYEIYDRIDKKVIGNYNSDRSQRRRAQTRADKLDNEYGAYRYYVRPVYGD